jgi:hypothetical protein
LKKIDATLIFPGLYQGSWPPPGHLLAEAGFKTLVLCAREFQPPHVMPPGMDAMVGLRAANPFPRVKVIYAPNDDNGAEPPQRADLALALRAAREVATSLKLGRKVLVTCWQGRNRSGLVSALAIHLVSGCSGFHAVRIVQKARRRALTNPQFTEILNRLRDSGPR